VYLCGFPEKMNIREKGINAKDNCNKICGEYLEFVKDLLVVHDISNNN
jgi:hypothetical protein